MNITQVDFWSKFHLSFCFFGNREEKRKRMKGLVKVIRLTIFMVIRLTLFQLVMLAVIGIDFDLIEIVFLL